MSTADAIREIRALTADQISARLEEIDREARALRTLLRAARCVSARESVVLRRPRKRTGEERS